MKPGLTKTHWFPEKQGPRRKKTYFHAKNPLHESSSNPTNDPEVTNDVFFVGIPDPKNVSCHPGGDDCILGGG